MESKLDNFNKELDELLKRAHERGVGCAEICRLDRFNPVKQSVEVVIEGSWNPSGPEEIHFQEMVADFKEKWGFNED